MAYQDLTRESVKHKQEYAFFLARPKGTHPVRGGAYVPTVVQLMDNKLFTPDNEIEPIIFSHKDDVMTPCDDPFQCNLEWCELP